VIITPGWKDADFYQGLIQAGYQPHEYTGIKYLSLGKEIRPKFISVFWVKNVDIKKII
jgi:hypothetical protein